LISPGLRPSGAATPKQWLHLLEAERVGPETVRHNVIAQELIRELLSRKARSQTSALSDLAIRAGILH